MHQRAAVGSTTACFSHSVTEDLNQHSILRAARYFGIGEIVGNRPGGPLLSTGREGSILAREVDESCDAVGTGHEPLSIGGTAAWVSSPVGWFAVVSGSCWLVCRRLGVVIQVDRKCRLATVLHGRPTQVRPEDGDQAGGAFPTIKSGHDGMGLDTGSRCSTRSRLAECSSSLPAEIRTAH